MIVVNSSVFLCIICLYLSSFIQISSYSYFIFNNFLSYFRISFKVQIQLSNFSHIPYLPLLKSLCFFSHFIHTHWGQLGLSWSRFKSPEVTFLKWNWLSFSKQPSDKKSTFQGRGSMLLSHFHTVILFWLMFFQVLYMLSWPLEFICGNLPLC